MAKKVKDLYAMNSTESSHKIYMFRKRRGDVKKIALVNDNKKDQNALLKLKKYDPTLRRHVLFVQKKAKK